MVFYWRHFCLIERHLTVWSLSVSSHLCEAFKVAAAIYPTVTLFVIGARTARRRGVIGAPFSPHSPPRRRPSRNRDHAAPKQRTEKGNAWLPRKP
jgi:hypothetical protein